MNVCIIIVSIILIFWVNKSLKKENEKYDDSVDLSSYLGGFGQPVGNFNDVPQLIAMQQQAFANPSQYSSASIGNMYLQTANRGRINNMM